MNKPKPIPETLHELWMIKDETAERFQTASAYFAHLESTLSSPIQKNKVAAKKMVRARRLSSSPAR